MADLFANQKKQDSIPVGCYRPLLTVPMHIRGEPAQMDADPLPLDVDLPDADLYADPLDADPQLLEANPPPPRTDKHE